MYNLSKSFAAACAFAGLISTSALAGGSSGSSLCSVSGLDDGSGLTGRTQSFGQNIAGGWYGGSWMEDFTTPVEAEAIIDRGAYETAAEEEFGNPGGLPDLQFYPGWACNPTVFDDRP